MLNIRSILFIFCLILFISFTEELRGKSQKQVCRPYKRKCIMDSDCCNSLVCLNDKCMFPPKEQDNTNTNTTNQNN